MINRVEFLQTIKQQFALDFDGINGLSHWERVAMRGMALASATGANPRVMAYFAYLHDSKRLNEDHDPEIGFRAFCYCRQLYAQGLIDLHLDELEQLCMAVRQHNMRHIAGDTSCQCCWDADRLDMQRVGKLPDPNRLFTDAGKQLAVEMRHGVQREEHHAH